MEKTRKKRQVPIAMFEQLGLIGNAIVLVVSLVILGRASNSTITNSVKIADITGLGKTTVGFILVAFSTSLPELFVAIFAIFQPENVGVSVGNVLGSNIVNICLILGICFLLLAIRSPKRMVFLPLITKEETGSLYFGLFIASIIPLSLVFIGYVSQFAGVVLITRLQLIYTIAYKYFYFAILNPELPFYNKHIQIDILIGNLASIINVQVHMVNRAVRNVWGDCCFG